MDFQVKLTVLEEKFSFEEDIPARDGNIHLLERVQTRHQGDQRTEQLC